MSGGRRTAARRNRYDRRKERRKEEPVRPAEERQQNRYDRRTKKGSKEEPGANGLLVLIATTGSPQRNPCMLAWSVEDVYKYVNISLTVSGGSAILGMRM